MTVPRFDILKSFLGPFQHLRPFSAFDTLLADIWDFIRYLRPFSAFDTLIIQYLRPYSLFEALFSIWHPFRSTFETFFLIWGPFQYLRPFAFNIWDLICYLSPFSAFPTRMADSTAKHIIKKQKKGIDGYSGIFLFLSVHEKFSAIPFILRGEGSI